MEIADRPVEYVQNQLLDQAVQDVRQREIEEHPQQVRHHIEPQEVLPQLQIGDPDDVVDDLRGR